MNHVRSIASIACAFMLFSGTMHAATVMRGNIKKDGAQKTFSFPVKAYAAKSDGSQIVVGAAAEKQDKYALARFDYRSSTCAELIHSECLDGYSKQISNPLFSQAIQSMKIAENFGGRGDCLVATTQQKPGNLYLVDNLATVPLQKRVYEVRNLVDASGAQLNGGIVGMAPAPLLAFNHQARGFGRAGVVFAAVRGHGEDSFGNGDSGIAAACLLENHREEEQLVKSDSNQDQKNEQNEEKEQKTEIRKLTEWEFGTMNLGPGGPVLPLNKSSEYIKIGNDLAEMGDVVAMYWHEKVQCLYVGLQVKAGDAEQDGAHALFVGKVGQHGLELKPVVPTQALLLDACNEIVGAVGAHATTSIYDIQSMRTQMLLDYLIVTGGNGAPQQAKRCVYALPILADPKMGPDDERVDIDALGTLAAKTNTIKKSYTLVQYGFKRWYHSFEKQATTREDLFTTEDIPENAPVRVGRGPVPYGEIVQTTVKDDAVIVTVKSDDKLRPSGMFVSQIIFNTDRHIAGWTAWSPIATMYDDVIGGSCNTATGIVSVVANCVDGKGTVVKRTGWSDNDTSLRGAVARVNELFTPEEGGVHGLFSFVSEDNELSALVVTGLKKAMLIAHEHRSTTFEQAPIQTRVLEGEALNKIGAITAAKLLTDQQQLFLGGVDGLAVSDNNLCEQFVHVGDYRFIKKLTYDNGYLYVLTDKLLDRIDVQASSFAKNELVRVRLASVDQLADLAQYSRFNDCIVSEKMCLLATSQGLLRIGDGGNVADPGLCNGQLDWQSVKVDGDVKGVVKLSAVSATGKEEDLARYCGGHVYVITGYIGKDRARVSRFYVADTSGSVCIDNTTIAKLPGFLGKHIGNAYASFKSFRNIFMTDGILNISARYQNDAGPLSLTNGFHKENTIMVLDAEHASRIVGVCRDPIAGNLLVAGDFGIRILE